MAVQIRKWLNKIYPQNYIVRKPSVGSLIITTLSFLFLTIYKPLQTHESRFFSYGLTMAIYCCAMSVPVIVITSLLKRIKCFSNSKEWTILKEIVSVLLILFGTGIAIYFTGFLIEIPSQRWNLPTFFDSCKSAFLITIIPVAFFTIINYRYLFVTDIEQSFKPQTHSSSPEQTEELLQISSQLKKEELSFYSRQFIYAESDGNYVVFYLNVDNKIKKEIIRNSINNITQQLAAIPFIMRTHRAFIVNVKKVSSQKGNTLGYHLKLEGTDADVPVSRQNARNFNRLLKHYQ
jgi:hypothetical protein